MKSLVILLCIATALLLVKPSWEGVRNGLSAIAFYYRQQAEYWRSLFLFVSPWQIALSHLLLGLLCTGLAYQVEILQPFCLIAGLAGVPILTIALKQLRRQREKQAVAQLPDALLALSGALKSGASFQGALECAVKEGLPPLNQELGLMLSELRMGTAVNLAFENLRTRIPDPDLSLFVSAISLNREVGGNLSNLLTELAETQRKKMEMQGRIDALTAQGRMQGWVMSGLPIFLGLVIAWIEPKTMALLLESTAGWAVLAISSVMLLMGFLAIRKVVRIDV